MFLIRRVLSKEGKEALWKSCIFNLSNMLYKVLLCWCKLIWCIKLLKYTLHLYFFMISCFFCGCIYNVQFQRHGSVLEKKTMSKKVNRFSCITQTYLLYLSICFCTVDKAKCLCFWQMLKIKNHLKHHALCTESVHQQGLKENQEAAETLTVWYQLRMTHVFGTRLHQIGKISWNCRAVWLVTRCGCVWVR